MNQETKEKFFNSLYIEMYPKMNNFVYRICKDAAFTEDVVQETFWEACRKIDVVMAHGEPRAWLYITLKNKMMKMGKKRNTLYPVEDEYFAASAEEDIYRDIELAESIKSSVGERDYNLLCDYYVNGYSSAEVAEKYHLDKGGMRMRISRLRKKLEKEISKNWIF